ncbi:hypothetical protein VNO77_34037 [Canavalia gladiata]|uniref:ATP-dependent DNA helicase n=1 Tax=Canavalia gladiata TaxID=3824 RepID=A0AAN9KG21_CANGL
MQSSQLWPNGSCSPITPQPFTKKRMCNPSPLTDISNINVLSIKKQRQLSVGKHQLVPFDRSLQKTIPPAFNQTNTDDAVINDVDYNPGSEISNSIYLFCHLPKLTNQTSTVIMTPLCDPLTPDIGPKRTSYLRSPLTEKRIRDVVSNDPINGAFLEHVNVCNPTTERLEKRYNSACLKFGMCCGQGKVKIPFLEKTPLKLLNLLQNDDSHNKYFIQNIRSFNMMFSFTSMGGTIDRKINDGNGPPMFVMNGENYHRIGSLLPLSGETPKFAQLYIYDTENEVRNKMNAVSMTSNECLLNKSIVQDLKEMLDVGNPYAKVYRMVRDRFEDYGIANVKLRIMGKRGHDGRRYNLPTASEVAALIVGDFDCEPTEKDVIVETQTRSLKRVSILNVAYLPMQYPLLFPHGEDGNSEEILLKHNKSSNKPHVSNREEQSQGRRRLSMREFIAFRIHERIVESPILFMSRRLFQQFLVDSYTMIESSRLSYIRTHQKQLRAELYNGVAEAILRGENNASTLSRRIFLPSSFTGGARYMFQNYQDAMALCRWTSYPDLFITFTCNQRCPEVVRALTKYGLNAEDRPDLLCRVFKIKLDELIREIKHGNVFGKVVSVVYTIEFQKRGLPHAHILVFLHSTSKYLTPDQIDSIICAQIPDEKVEPELRKIVETLMIHGPYGAQNRKSPCMHNGKCIRYFPKKYVQKTTIDNDGYPLYRRQDNGRTVQKDKASVDNKYVVPYNKYLLLKYNEHINVEWCNQSRSIKYLFKYVNKGHDRVTTSFYQNGQSCSKENTVDEIKLYYDCRYLSSCEAVWRIFSYDIHYREPSVERLSFHLPDQHVVVFQDDDTLDDIANRPSSITTKFLAWMEANKKYDEGRTLTYAEFPTKFVWKQFDHEWTIRKRGFSIGRLYFVPPGSGELYYLRLVLNRARGVQSYRDIRTVNDITYATFKDACYSLGLLDDDKEYIDAIKQASQWGIAFFLRKLFVTLLISNQIERPEIVWNSTCIYLSDNLLYRQRQRMQQPDLQLTDAETYNLALYEIQKLLESNNRTLSEYPSMPQPEIEFVSDFNNRLIMDELQYDKEKLARDHLSFLTKMTDEQMNIYNKIMESVDVGKSKIFFVYGYGGTGKTFLWKSISARIRSKGDIVLTVASSGIAALLLPGGMTTHSRFAIPIMVTEDSACNIKQGSPLAELIIKAKLIIWDEAPMTHKYCFEAVDRTFRDILRFSNPHSYSKPFGGKVIVFGGDFRQILPVIPKGSRQDVVHASINSSYLWEFCEVLTLTKNMRLHNGSSNIQKEDLSTFCNWILSIGDGSIGDENEDSIHVDIPPELIIKDSCHPIQCIVESTYPNFLDNVNDPSFFQNRAILAPTNEIVNAVNDYMLSLMPG